MASQKEQVKAAQDKPEGQDDNAEFSETWNELAAAEAGQPSAAEGRQADSDSQDDQEGDEAGQAAAEASGTPDADADEASRETSDDIWANAPASLREAYQAEQAARKKADNLVRSNGARAAQAQNELHALKAQLNTARDEQGAAGEGEESPDPKERLAQLREEYPEVAAPILDQMAALETQVQKLTAGQASQEDAATEEFLASQVTELASRHDDFADVVQSTEYAQWLGEQVPAIHRVIQENSPKIVNAAECAWVLDLFKQDTSFGADKGAESLAEKRARQLEAGTGVTKRPPAIAREQTDSFDDEWDRRREDDRRAASAGRR